MRKGTQSLDSAVPDKLCHNAVALPLCKTAVSTTSQRPMQPSDLVVNDTRKAVLLTAV